jgi:hypothetical protein
METLDEDGFRMGSPRALRMGVTRGLSLGSKAEEAFFERMEA